jgi:hypothetical protein
MTNYEVPYANFRVFDLTDVGESTELANLVRPDLDLTRAVHYIINELIGRGSYSSAKSAILESEYTDQDFIRAYSFFFSRLYRDVPKLATRVHFFSDKFGQPDLPGLKGHKESYLGSVVLRPLRLQTVGRSYLQQLLGVSDSGQLLKSQKPKRFRVVEAPSEG